METRGRARGAGRGKDGSPSAAHIPPDGGDGMLWVAITGCRALEAASSQAPSHYAPAAGPQHRALEQHYREQARALPPCARCAAPSVVPSRDCYGALEALWGPMEPLKGPPCGWPLRP
ncbi:hypothetical protein TgHK011_003080 [Trichoderma gracile]|nr:hypothetical protein TgHK011_003080 [Trichoderma gracile]